MQDVLSVFSFCPRPCYAPVYRYSYSICLLNTILQSKEQMEESGECEVRTEYTFYKVKSQAANNREEPGMITIQIDWILQHKAANLP